MRKITIPTTCEFCGEKLVNEGSSLYCPNPNCPETILHRVQKWEEVMEIKFLAHDTLVKLRDADVIEDIHDLYRMKLSDVKGVDGFGDGFSRVIKEIDAKREVTIAQFVAGLDIDGVGEKIIKKITDALKLSGWEGMKTLKDLPVVMLVGIPGVGTTMADKIHDGINELWCECVLIHDAGVKVAEKVEVKSTGGSLSGKSFCFTGALSIKRKEAQALVEAAGGTNADSVSKTLTYLVTDDPNSGSSKNEKAKKLGVQVIDEKTFLKMVGK
jgi:DNA ligase (NAD+)